MTPAYDVDGIHLYQGDVLQVLRATDLQDIAVVLTDPPYATWGYLRETEERGSLDIETDTRWMAETFAWVGTWWWEMRQRLRPDALVWVFCNLHYVGFYLRWGHYSGLPLRGFFSCPPSEFLLVFAAHALPVAMGPRISAACALNTYGQNKPLPLLRALLRDSPPGLVLDPFAGLGSTLDAVRAEGRSGVGIEIQEPLVRQTVGRWA